MPAQNATTPDRGAAGLPAAFELRVEQADPNGAQCTLVVPAGSRLYDGHFVGQPICPGYALLAIVAAAARETGLGEVAGCARVRFRAPIAPGEPVQLALTRDERSCAFALSKDGAPIANGRLDLVVA
jgi:3-hydroxymyristoyl/3-hydroxydecanoyl-(acyl carrier protein) dehydratase